MLAVHRADPGHGRMRGNRLVPSPQRLGNRTRERILKLWRIGEGEQQSRCRQVRHGEASANQVLASSALGLFATSTSVGYMRYRRRA